jgi:hypothetical protein
VTKLEFAKLQLQLITIIEALRDGDLQHYQVERMLEMELRKLHGENGTSIVNEKKENKDAMFG